MVGIQRVSLFPIFLKARKKHMKKFPPSAFWFLNISLFVSSAVYKNASLFDKRATLKNYQALCWFSALKMISQQIPETKENKEKQ